MHSALRPAVLPARRGALPRNIVAHDCSHPRFSQKAVSAVSAVSAIISITNAKCCQMRSSLFVKHVGSR